MTSKKKRTRRPAAPPERLLAKFLRLPFIFLVIVVLALAFMLAVTLLIWPILVGLQHVTDCCFIPHASETYMPMGALSGRGLLDYPMGEGRFDVLMVNAPIGFIALFWWLFVFGVLFATWRPDSRWAPLPRRCMLLAAGTAVALLLCLPFVRQYEILSGHTMLVKRFFDWNEQAYPLERLTRIHYSRTGRGLVSWEFGFSDGRQFSMMWPKRDVLALLLAQPKVSANVRLVDGRIVDEP